MEIENVIVDILERNEYVSLPGVGSFVRRYVPPQVEYASNRLIPHRYTISFRRDRQFDDGSIAQHLRNDYAMTGTEAEIQVITWSNALSKRLDEGERVTFRAIGTLRKEGEEYTLDSEFNDAFAFDSFGFQPIALPIPLRAHTGKKGSRKRAYLALPIALAAACAGTCFYGYHIGAEWITNNPLTRILIQNGEDSTGIPTQSKNPEFSPLQSDLKVNVATSQSLDSAHVQKHALSYQEIKAERRENYLLIAGSFSNYENARRQLEILSREDFQPEIIVAHSMYRVCVGRFNDKQMALKELERIRARKGDSAIWLLEMQ